MKFKFDENLPAECAVIFRDAGFDAATVAEQKLSGADDALLFQRCCNENRVLVVTLDLDFANVQAYPPASHSGIVVIRSNSQDKATVISILRRTLPVLVQRSPERQLWIVEPDRIRYREV